MDCRVVAKLVGSEYNPIKDKKTGTETPMYALFLWDPEAFLAQDKMYVAYYLPGDEPTPDFKKMEGKEVELLGQLTKNKGFTKFSVGSVNIL